ncbi:MAG: hypothetical protein ACRDL8_18360, partial [Solirubrobacteraceae bacterium]
VRVRIRVGQTSTVKLHLNATGRRLLRQRRKLSALATLYLNEPSGGIRIVGTRKLAFRPSGRMLHALYLTNALRGNG